MSHWLGRAALMLPLLLVGALATAQTPLPLPALDLRVNGTVKALLREPDGHLVLGGTFASVDHVPRANLARLMPDGSLDSGWDPGADGGVNVIVRDASGNVFVGGKFTHIAGTPRNNLAKLASSGALDVQWNPSPSGEILALALDGSGSIYAGGAFGSFAADAGAPTPHAYLARLSAQATATLDSAWNPAPDALVDAIAVDAAGVYVAGRFKNLHGQSRKGVARVSAGGTGPIDASWNVSLGVPADASVAAFALDGAGWIYLAGEFGIINGSSRYGVAKVSTVDGSLSPWVVNPSMNVIALALSGGYLYMGGDGFPGGRTLARANASGFDNFLQRDPNGAVSALLSDGSGGIYLGGSFSSADGSTAPRYAFAHMDATDSWLPTARVDRYGIVTAIVKQHGGATIVAGDFLEADGVPRGRMLRLLPDRTLDPNWSVSFDVAPAHLAVDSADDVFVIGDFNTVDRAHVSGVAKVFGQASGGIDPTWISDAGPSAHAVVVCPDDTLFVGGMTFLHKVSRTGTGRVDWSWNPGPNRAVDALACDSGFLYVGGQFSSFGNSPSSHIARFALGAAPQLDQNWQPLLGLNPTVVVLDGRGHLYAGGASSGFYGDLVRINVADATLDAWWNPAPLPLQHAVSGLAVQPSGDIIVGSYSPLAGETGALQKISAAGTGAVDPHWETAVDGNIFAVTSDAGGNVFVGGSFTQIAGASRTALAVVSDAEIFWDGFDAR